MHSYRWFELLICKRIILGGVVWFWGSSVRWGTVRIGCSGEHWDLRGCEKKGNSVMRCFVNLYCSRDNVSRGLRTMRCKGKAKESMRVVKRSAYNKTSIGQPEGKGPFHGIWRTWKGNTEVNLKEKKDKTGLYWTFYLTVLSGLWAAIAQSV